MEFNIYVVIFFVWRNVVNLGFGGFKLCFNYSLGVFFVDRRVIYVMGFIFGIKDYGVLFCFFFMDF